MFEKSDKARVFGVPPGVDFPVAVAEGVKNRLKGSPPETLARVRILVNTRRMQRKIRSIFASGHASLLPRIGLVTDIADLVLDADLPELINPLQRRLDIAELVAALIEADPTLAPRSALFDLTDSLVALLDELQGEDVAPGTITGMDIDDLSGHWERSRKFLSLVSEYVSCSGQVEASPEAHRRKALAVLVSRWTLAPPDAPIIVAGSTGSRGTTSALMQAVAGLPQGALILPGFDTDLPLNIWSRLFSATITEDHPQYRFAALLSDLELTPDDVSPWSGNAPNSRRNTLISLSLRPAPVTDQWLTDGQKLRDLEKSVKDMALIEAPNPRIEATAIAVAMHEAVNVGHKVALVTPDRTLGRRVTSALGRWGIVPDDSAGRPLAQTAPGRLLRHVMHQSGRPLTSEALITLLRHPLTRTDGTDRGPHLLMTQEFELFLRKHAVFAVDAPVLDRFADIDPARKEWSRWVSEVAAAFEKKPESSVGAHILALVERCEALARGPSGSGSGELWEKEAGRDARRVIDELLAVRSAGPSVTASDVARLVDRALQGENTRNSDVSRADVMIWGTLEARVQGADLVILGGLNEDTWPARPNPDPWLNRKMRRELGLLLPERQIGLSAHDYQQAVAARHVVLSRSRKDDDAETVPSRWLNRLTNLLDGLPDQGGKEALAEMRRRGNRLVEIAQNLDRPAEDVKRVARPAPAPPVHLRPKKLSVTEIEKLIRDPYAIYARHVLGLRSLNRLRPEADAAMRGTAMHSIMYRLLKDGPFEDADTLERRFLSISESVLSETVPWPAVRAHWLAHLATIAPGFSQDEMQRQSEGAPAGLEVWGEYELGEGPFGIKGKADRIDRLADGSLAIYDYKSGGAPTVDQIIHFQRQLPIEAVMAEAGAFKDVEAASVSFVSHIGLNKALRNDRYEMIADDKKDLRTVTIQGELAKLLAEYSVPDKGYPSRRAMEKIRWDGDYDHLARFGEWDVTDKAKVIPLK